MVDLNFDINKNYSLDLTLFYKYRRITDGIDFIEAHIVWDRYKDDHKPSFSIWLSIFNFCLIDFEIYNIHHIKEK